MNYALENVVTVGSVGFPLYRFDNHNIVLNSISGIISVDTIGNELSVDEFSFTVRHDPGSPAVYAPVGADAYNTRPGALYSVATRAGRDYMTELPFGTPVYWHVEGQLMKKGYLRSVNRVGKLAWKIECISGVGLLENSYHAGGIYSPATFKAILDDVVDGAFPYSVSEEIQNAPVFGWLPYDTRRNNLHRLLFALGAAMLPGDEDTDYAIGFLPTPGTPDEIPDSRISINGSVDYQLPATGVEVTEHAFLQTVGDETVQLFDATNPDLAGNQLVLFPAPCYGLIVTDTLQIVESGVNYAIVTGHGVLSGKKYSHNESVVALSTGSAGTPLIKRVTDNCLVSALNSRNVAERVLAYYSSAKIVGAKIMLDDEKCGSPYSFNDAFGDPTVAYLKQMQVSVTSIKSAKCSFVEGYSPVAQGNNYSGVQRLTGVGTFTATKSSMKIVLVGGGHGGYSGTDGSRGVGYGSTGNGQGGAAGRAGEGGKIFVIELSGVTPGTQFAFSCGTGGASDEAGTATTFGSYSSEDGAVTLNGFVEIFSGVRIGISGQTGVDGGNAPIGDEVVTLSYKGHIYISGETASTYVVSPGHYLYGGSGGGPAAGANGGDGYVGGVTTQSGRLLEYGGMGGDGADAVAGDAATEYGNGGNGGNGGGGGGRGGLTSYASAYTQFGTGGSGGKGSKGGAGGAGCIYVYS